MSMLFTKKDNEDNLLTVSLYLDDFTFTRSNELMIEGCRRSMNEEFDIADHGRMRHFLGVEVMQDMGCISITQQRYATEILDKFATADCKTSCKPSCSWQ